MLRSLKAHGLAAMPLILRDGTRRSLLQLVVSDKLAFSTVPMPSDPFPPSSSSSVESTIIEIKKKKKNDLSSETLPKTGTLRQTFQHIETPKTVSIIGAPMSLGQPLEGVCESPARFRQDGILNKLTSLGWRVVEEDDTDLDCTSIMSLYQQEELSSTIYYYDDKRHPNAKNSLLVGRFAELLAQKVEETCMAGHFPLILGGDHSVALGSLAGILRMRPHTGVLWVDAHADLNTPSTSESGNMHGMPLGLLMNGLEVDYQNLIGCEWLGAPGAPRLNPKDLVYVGLRDVDYEEQKAIRDLGICAFTMYDIEHHGIATVMKMAMDHLLKEDPERPLHLSFDIDSVDPKLAPATGTIVPDGLSSREAQYICERVAASGLLASADVVELNMDLSDAAGVKATFELGSRLIGSIMGKSALLNIESDRK